ncbi:MAG: TlpA family protein disulfide reductase [Leptothrix sp. (in: b-proteobacteria)]
MRPTRRAALAALLAVPAAMFMLLPATPARATNTAGTEAKIGDLLPADTLLTGLNGTDRRLSAYRGKRLVINVWASWCGPCRQEMASLERLAWQPGDAPLTVIGISTDDYRDRALGWLQSSNATLSHFIDHQVQLETLLGASRIPLTVLVDERGRVVEKVYGAQAWDGAEARALIRRAFGKAKAGAARP